VAIHTSKHELPDAAQKSLRKKYERPFLVLTNCSQAMHINVASSTISHFKILFGSKDAHISFLLYLLTLMLSKILRFNCNVKIFYSSTYRKNPIIST
jgi:hypothetical protein